MLAFDPDPGKHGETQLSERNVLTALADGQADAGTVSEPVWEAEQAAGRVDLERFESLWTSPSFDGGMLDARPDLSLDLVQRFQRVLVSLQWQEPRQRALLELGGLQQWLPRPQFPTGRR